jgi:hypothetical protein
MTMAFERFRNEGLAERAYLFERKPVGAVDAEPQVYGRHECSVFGPSYATPQLIAVAQITGDLLCRFNNFVHRARPALGADLRAESARAVAARQ